ncbi:MAG TPA: type II toxin-antitoxin system RelE/ParE family toxin [Thermoanaerobaculia bacterium]|nr:type II toxin-antitoxin system RelE/ParE family toxin [Thermoanaerobaculia bacterium]
MHATGCQITEFVANLNMRTKNRLFGIIKKTAEEGKYEEEEIYRHIGEGIWEFKAQTARIYSFCDGSRRIVLTHAGYKPNKNMVKSERQKAVAIRHQYDEWKRTAS